MDESDESDCSQWRDEYLSGRWTTRSWARPSRRTTRTDRPRAPTPSRTPCRRSGHSWMPPTPAPPGARGSLSWRTRHGGPSSSRRARTTPRPRPTTRRASGAPTRAWCGGCRGRERGRGRRDPVYYLTILHFFFQLKRHGWDERGSMSRPVRGSVPPARAAWTAPSSIGSGR